MATFEYIARDGSGQRIVGRLAGASEQAVLSELHARDLAPVRVQELKERRSRRRVSARQLATSYRQLSDLLRASVPMLRALRLLGRSKSNPALAEVWARVAEDVSEGARLADAMGQFEQVFPNVQLAMVRAGERGGFLEDVLERMGTFLEQQADMRGKVIGNLIYPALLLAVGVGVLVWAMLVFVPKFEQFYSRMEVPWPTQALMTGSDLLQSYWLVLVGVIVAAVVGFIWARRHAPFRRRVATMVNRTPRLGTLVQAMAVARFARILGTLLENGIALLTAMQISRDAAGHILLEEAIEDATEAVRSGESLSDPLAASGMFSDDVLEMISIGESANNLAPVLINIADTIEKRIDRMLAIFLRLIEPLLLMGIALIVVFIFVALIVPMLQLSSAI